MKSLRATIVVLTLSIVSLVQGQIYNPEGLNLPGDWNSWTNPPVNNLALASSTQVPDGRVMVIPVGTQRWQTIFSVAATGADLTGGTYNWLFTSGPADNPYNNKWAGVSAVIDDLQEYTYGGATDNNITLTDDHWYTMNWEDAGYQNTRAIFMETSAEPVEITSVSIPATADPDVPVTIDITLASAPCPEEIFYLRYTTDNWQTSELSTISLTGTNGTALIPGTPAGTVVWYYALSTTVPMPTENHDLYTILYNNNGDQNYSYTVSGGSTTTIGWANLQFPGSGVIEPGDSFEVFARVWADGITGGAGQGSDITAWIGINDNNTDPATWTTATWVPADYYGDVGNNDEYMTDLGLLVGLGPGVYYYASRFQYQGEAMVYGGWSDTGGGFWDGTDNINGVLTVNGVPPPPVIAWANLQWPGSGAVTTGQEFLVYGQAWIDGYTGQGTATEGLEAWVGYSDSDTDPVGWTNWIEAPYLGASGSNDEFMADLGAVITTPGIWYYATRFVYAGQDAVYGGFSDGGGGFWDGMANISGVLTVSPPAQEFPVHFEVTDATGLYSNIKFKGDMTSWEPVPMVQNGNLWSLDMDVAAGSYEWGVIEDDGTPLGIWLIIGPNRVVNVSDEGIVTGDTTYTITLTGMTETEAVFSLYPNPAKDQLTLLRSVGMPATITLYDGQGRAVLKTSSSDRRISIDIHGLPAGYYRLILDDGLHKQSQPLIIH